MLFIALIWTLFSSPANAAFNVPPYQGYVTDLAHVISDEDTARINAVAQQLDTQTHAQLAVLTVDTLDNTPIDTASLETARNWGIGSKKAGNTGLLILLAVKERKVRTEIGYGLEGIITDGTSGAIQDQYMLPSFKQNQFSTGLLQGYMAYAQLVAQANHVSLQADGNTQSASQSAQTVKVGPGSRGSSLFIMVIFGLIILFALFQMFTNPGGFLSFLMGLFLGGFLGGGRGGGGGNDDDNDGGGFGGFGGGGFGGGGSDRDF